MADIKLIKELRDRTGSGFIDVKNALEASNNDLGKAVVWLQEHGVAKAAKKAGNIAAEGVVNIAENDKSIVIYEINSQTDFVAQTDLFKDLVQKIGKCLLENIFTNIDEANQAKVNGKTIKELTDDVTATIGEKIILRRAKTIAKDSSVIGAYVHTNNQVAAIVLAEGGDSASIRNVAMHVASMNPLYLDESQVPSDKLDLMKNEISNDDSIKTKPEHIQGKIAEGMLRKQLSEITLVDQEFVMEKISVSKYLTSKGAKATKMIRFEVGEGVEVKEVDFAAEVVGQMKSK
ncbi:translation elongation factor Ts [Candidatus Mycoplasma mahonii]|uniref:translation elongation factor Ts n=1 Tax=Candidatus Mycoplasma mahonii TaxID=3004105 RepID=UPI0026EDC10F|nr:translation elongation factor Ts [Candidatus Mycoplasma mahonii]WKX02623.1 translation elongation factor Ts [Candidatus Mycoplasma mahonii]